MIKHNRTPFSEYNIRISSVWLHITSQCNSNCLYCYDDGNCSKEMDSNVCKTIMNLIEQFNLSSLLLVGGEPTLHQNLTEILSITSKVCNPILVTNGTTLSDISFFKDVIKCGVGSLQISLPSTNSSVYEQTTQNVGGLDKVLKTLENAKKLNFSRVGTMTTITKLNFNHLTDIIDFNIDYGLTYTSFNICSPPIQASKNQVEKLCLSPKDYANKIQELYAYSTAKNHPIHIATNLPKCVFEPGIRETLIERNVISISPCEVFTGSSLHFLSDGSIIPCSHMYDEVLGNPISDKVKPEQFVEWLGTSKRREVRSKIWCYPSKNCKTCSEWGKCIGGCPILWGHSDPEEFLTAITPK